MKKEKIQQIMYKHNILACDVENAIEFVRDLLEMQATELEENEPYAVRTIDRLWNAARDVIDLLEYVENAE